uniref:Uncharacterized protein n=1 Tax=Aegilops tauschii subsp. strangulata TaxID=200361 RepID=A0A453LBI5_AEGTS
EKAPPSRTRHTRASPTRIFLPSAFRTHSATSRRPPSLHYVLPPFLKYKSLMCRDFIMDQIQMYIDAF